MYNLQDDELIAVVRERLAANQRAISDLRELTGELEAANRRLMESEALKGHFLSNIRNEINNPLAAIIGFSHQLLSGNMNVDQTAQCGRFIYDGAQELNFQLENVFTAAGLEAGVEMPDPVTVDAAAVLKDVMQRFEHSRTGKELEICCHTDADLPVVVDPRFLQIIVSNLLANAMEYSPAKGVVTVDISLDDACLRVEVADQGPGIDAVDHETIFDRFRQLDRGRCKSHRGLGLGLSVSRALAELSGGGITVQSALGSGSRFTLTMPVQLPPEDSLLSTEMEKF